MRRRFIQICLHWRRHTSVLLQYDCVLSSRRGRRTWGEKRQQVRRRLKGNAKVHPTPGHQKHCHKKPAWKAFSTWRVFFSSRETSCAAIGRALSACLYFGHGYSSSLPLACTFRNPAPQITPHSFNNSCGRPLLLVRLRRFALCSLSQIVSRLDGSANHLRWPPLTLSWQLAQ